MGDTKRGRERKHRGKESQVLEQDLHYAKRVETGEVAEEYPLDEGDIELDEETQLIFGPVTADD
ncbi:hypothetical protein [Haloarchaeobius sp. DFWS5]|uniref:hypothetical protein n=1 Tax=Haloarchaeobius sp. DFWS5 TaxID=3446114 RepID=UPI003EBDB152